MRYELRIRCADRDEAEALRDLLSDLCKVELIQLSGADEYRTLDVRSWPMANYLLSRMDESRTYQKEDIGGIVEEMGWSANSIPTLLVKLTSVGVLRKLGTGLYRKVKNDE